METELATKKQEKSLEVSVELLDGSNDAVSSEPNSLTEEQLREKTNIMMGGRASNDRKWRDIQSAFASILKACLFNTSCRQLLKHDQLLKLRLEYELWCPLCEAFAPSPWTSKGSNNNKNDDDNNAPKKLMEPISFPDVIAADHFRLFAQSRAAMQMEILGFVPNVKPVSHLLHKGSMCAPIQSVSDAMNHLYDTQYRTTPEIHQRREHVRRETELIVSQCPAFPKETKVVVFGSSANGFGSPNSDVDMCLQLPAGFKLDDEEDKNGSVAMGKLVELFESRGVKNVDPSRLTARIPVIMFDYPMKVASEEAEMLIDCDLSMQNPLACLNTSLILNYSHLDVRTRVLASIIKRWAKSREINNPAQHTLSSYGYILMLLHFLTYHRATNEGIVMPIDEPVDPRKRAAPTPLLPNLQWMDPAWANSKDGKNAGYQELKTKPKNLIPHPTEPDFVVNAYFYRLNSEETLQHLQRKFGSEYHQQKHPSVGTLLAAFFHYYAYEFDYKHHVVSLNATMAHGKVEREVKAEHDTWKVYGQGLSIEDPFETFYDVAHVVKASNFHRIRREFALAYTKMVDAATGNNHHWSHMPQNIGPTMSGSEILDWICEPLPKDTDDSNTS